MWLTPDLQSPLGPLIGHSRPAALFRIGDWGKGRQLTVHGPAHGELPPFSCARTLHEPLSDMLPAAIVRASKHWFKRTAVVAPIVTVQCRAIIHVTPPDLHARHLFPAEGLHQWFTPRIGTYLRRCILRTGSALPYHASYPALERTG